jgi:hypothetical protein
MTARAMIHRVSEAAKMVRALGGQGFVAMEECRGDGRKAAAEMLGQQMHSRVGAPIERCKNEGWEDRRNGS